MQNTQVVKHSRVIDKKIDDVTESTAQSLDNAHSIVL